MPGSKQDKRLAAFCGLALTLFTAVAAAQDRGVIMEPDRKHLFISDQARVEQARRRKVKEVLRTDQVSEQVDFKSDNVKFDRDKNEVSGSGGVVVSRGGLQAQAESGKVNLDTKDAELRGDVLLNYSSGVLSADSADMNLDTETGKFSAADFTMEDGAYRVAAGEAEKVSDVQYELKECWFSTCHCEDNSTPWRISADEASVTQEGYAHTYGTSVNLFGLPLLYTPYFAFPVKQERQSGLLVPSYSYSSEDGFGLKLPLFMVLNDSIDTTVSPFFEAKTRAGSFFDYRQALSRSDYIRARMLYSDESQRGDSLRGTLTDGLFDPTFDEDRFAGFLKGVVTNDSDSAVPLALVSDIHYVSDDLVLREIEDEDIGEPQSRFATSQISLRAGLGDFAQAVVGGEYNQSLITDDDLVFQRLPELVVDGSRSFRPFGFNPYGFKVVPGARLYSTNFDRDEGYDGWRTDIYPNLRMPFSFGRYMRNEISAGFHQTYYDLEETFDPARNIDLDPSQTRGVGALGYLAQTSLERVYEVDADSSLAYLTSLGARNQDNKLARVKHTIEPFLRYTYIPDVSQDSLPLFDSLDRYREKSLFTLGARTSLYGRFLPRREVSEPIPELAPLVQDLPLLGQEGSLPDYGEGILDSGGAYGLRSGEVREIAYMTIKQAYDYTEDIEDNDPLRSEWSDIYLDLGLNPTANFGFRYETNYSIEDRNVSSWAVSSHLMDDRGDALRARFTYIENSISQIEGNAEAVLTDRTRAGYYALYDELEREFIENGVALRLFSSCDCWRLDLGYRTKINPDREQVFLTFTFSGLGDLTQSFGLGRSGSQG